MAGKKAEAVAIPEPQAAEPDIDAMDDTQFATFKADMNKETAQEPAPEPAAVAKSVEDVEDDSGEDDAAVDAKKLVPHGQFHRERERRKEAERLAELSSKRLAELLEAMQPQQQRQETAAPQVPDPDVDIFAHAKHLEAQIQAMQQESTQTKQQREAQDRFDRILQASQQDVQAYAQENPAILPATQFLVNQVAAEMQAYGKLSGRTFTQDELLAEINQREAQIVDWAIQNKRRPAEVFYELALSRGFSPSAVAEESTAEPTDIKAEIEKMVRTEATRAKAKSLGGSGAPGGVQNFTPKDIEEMSDEDFAAFKKKFGDNAMSKVFGVAH